ncbi:MAG: hypothetical protein EBS05_03370 [Proteobacteria bacterium]|nr:hypothetical protein [Pseudomonadota bacterium]
MKSAASPFRSSLLVLLSVLCTALAMPALAQKKAGSLAGFPLWTAKKNPVAGPFVPGLNAALLLTDEQKAKLHAAREETLGNPELQKLGASLKQNPNASEADRAAATKAFEEARGQFKDRVDTILTADQRKLIASISALFEEVSVATGEAYRDRFAQLKGDKASAAEVYKEASEKNTKDFKGRLEGLLSKDQWAALTKAAEDEEAAAKNAVKVKKP